MENGDLSQYLVKDPDSDRRNLVCVSRVTTADVLIVFSLHQVYEIACGVEYLHSRKIVHSDLKCVRLLLLTPLQSILFTLSV